MGFKRDGSDSDGDAFGGGEGGVFGQTAPIQHRENELFCFEPKDNQVEAIQHLLCDRSDQILITETGFGKSVTFQAAPRSRKSRNVRAYENAGVKDRPLKRKYWDAIFCGIVAEWKQ
ncbi:hypothetical protein V8E54_009877 [Elaphomyces granulatus]